MTQIEVTKYFNDLYNGGAIYVWAMNGDIINEQTIEYAYKHHSSSQYDKAYYEAKLKEGYGHIGADCSGSFYHVSGFDTTAHGYYTRCKEKGAIKTLPNKACQVFVKKKGTNIMGHVGWYDGHGYVIEMKSSKANCVKSKLDSRWTDWGIPTFVDYVDEKDTCMIELDVLKKGMKGNEVKTVQRLLKSMGYSIGLSGIDGDFGAKTEKAVIKYQTAKKLTADGVVGKATWEKLLK